MRDLFVTLVIFGSLPFILQRPFIGIMVWAWLSYMNPHRLCWGFAYSFPFAQIVALTTLAAMLLSREKKQIPWTRETIVLLMLIGWMFLTTVYSLYPVLAWPQWDKVWKIMLVTYLTMMLINDEYRLKVLMFMIALSLGFYGFKGGIFVLTGGSENSVLGPEGSFISERNSIGLALIMTVPLLNYMRTHCNAQVLLTIPVIRNFVSERMVRTGLLVGAGLTLVAVIGTHSRGALVGVSCMLLFYLLKSRQKMAAILMLIPMVITLVAVMPDEYFDRMATIQTWQEDKSASERVRAWGNAIDLANERFIGGGMRALVLYGGRDSHSIYFGMLGEHGWVGLFLFLLLILYTWRSATWIIRQSKPHPELAWARDLAAMLQVSLVGFLSAGAFLGLHYFDLFYHYVAIIVMTRKVVQGRLDTVIVGPEKNPHATANAARSTRHYGEGPVGAAMTSCAPGYASNPRVLPCI